MSCKYHEKNDTTANVAIFIAILSLGVSGFLGWKAIEHNQMSVAPILDISIRFTSETDKEQGIFIRNSGLGPAIIEEVIVFWNKSEQYKPNNKFESLSNNLKVNNMKTYYSTIESGNSLEPGKEMTIYGLGPSNLPKITADVIAKNLQVYVKYKSLYDVIKTSYLFNNS